jgi:hypothetical protein
LNVSTKMTKKKIYGNILYMTPESPMSFEELAKILNSPEKAKDPLPTKEKVTYESARQEIKIAVNLLAESGIPAESIFIRGSAVTGGGKLEDKKSEAFDYDILYLTKETDPTEFINVFNDKASPFKATRERMFTERGLEENIPGYVKIVRKDGTNNGADILVYNREVFEWLARNADSRKNFREGELIKRAIAEGILLKGETPKFMVEIAHDAGYDREIPKDEKFLA